MRRRALFRTIIIAGTALASMMAAPAQPAPDPSRQVSVAGPFQTMFDWKSQRCEQWDVPDAPARAFRDAGGQIVLFASDDKNRSFTGRSLLQLRHGCGKALDSRADPDPAAYAGSSFITATWTEDGRHVAALVHDEYHADRYPGRCRFATTMACWYNAIVAAGSSDGGRSFTTALRPILVAGATFRQDVDQGRHRGFFNPSNIVRMAGAYYFMANTTGGGAQRPGVCLFRSANPLNPTSWRGLTAGGYRYRATNPYRPDSRRTGVLPCQPIAVGGAPGSISYHRSSGRFLSVMQATKAPDAASGAIRYSWSTDLVHWSPAMTLLRLPILGSQSCGDKARYAYPSLIDDDGGRNFDSIGANPWLFLTRMVVSGCHETVERDLIRIRLRIAG
jgi:hypothetical protein